MESKKIFLMYSSKDLLKVRKVYTFLTKKTNYNIWFAPNFLTKSSDVDSEIKFSLEEADTILFFMSINSSKKSLSIYLSKEIQILKDLLLKGYEKKIINIRIGDDGLYPDVLSNFQKIDLTSLVSRNASPSPKRILSSYKKTHKGSSIKQFGISKFSSKRINLNNIISLIRKLKK